MTHRLLSTSLPLLLTLTWAGCDQSRGTPGGITTVVGPSVEEAAKPDQPIRISSGQLVYDISASPVPHIDVKGPKGFRLESTFEGPFGPEQSCIPCEPGDRVLLNSVAVGFDVRGTVTLRGKTYDRISGGAERDASLGIEFKGDGSIAPPFTDATSVELSGAPFTFSGTFSYYPEGSVSNVTETLTGSGIATVRLMKVTFGPDDFVWRTSYALFEFTK